MLTKLPLMKNILLVFVVLCCISCTPKKEDITFHECEFRFSEVNNNPFDHIEHYKKWIDNKQEAIRSNLYFYELERNKRNLDSLYKTKAHYLFIIGGGGIWVRAKDCNAEIKNDTLFIAYTPKWNRKPVGEAAPTMMCLELDKTKYPNYKALEIVYIQR